MKKKYKIAILVVVVVAGTMVATIAYGFIQTKKASDALRFEDVDIAHVKDGTYVGECDLSMVKVVAQVQVEDGKLVDIQLLQHENGKGETAEQNIIKMTRENRLDVDSVSGATVSSKAIRKACESALQKGL